MAKSNPSTAEPLGIEQLKQKYEALRTKQTQAETRLSLVRDQLAQLRNEAKAAYGTDDIAELKQKLEQLNAENDQKRTAYQASLAKIEADLAAVEREFAAADGSATGRNGA